MFGFARKSIRLPAQNYRGLGCFIITLCCVDRRPIFRQASVCDALTDLLRSEAQQFGFEVLAYCFMPDHLHVLIQARTASAKLSTFVKCFKQKSGYRHARETGDRLWQRFFYDHILRGSESAETVAWYIWLNPVRGGLCNAPQDYPFSGSFVRDWRAEIPPRDCWTPPWKFGARMAT